MSSKRFSPTANLLRTSRFFALPSPLPRPLPELTSTQTFSSDTATLPYPTHAAITTPNSSLGRGDWGLKRPLPLRSTTNTSTPVIRIGAVDTMEHITEYESAADHVLTVRKFQEMNIALSVPQAARPISITPTLKPRQSVFELESDNTHLRPGDPSANALRWKFKGPWLGGKTEGEFHRYLEKEIRRRRTGFRRFIREHAAVQKAAEQRRIAVESGEVPENWDAVTAKDISEDELQEYIVSLRNDNATLKSLIHQFLDLPALPKLGQVRDSYFSIAEDSASPYAETGPPKTHPSAGLSYLRTSAYVYNHPLLGPQAYPTPIQARILQPRRSTLGNNNIAKLGIGGVVVRDSIPASFRQDRLPDGIPGLSSLDPSIPGGAKLWIHPRSANIDVQGRIMINTIRAAPITIAIHEGMKSTDSTPQDTAAESETANQPLRRMPSLFSSTTSKSRGYGIEGLRQANSGRTGSNAGSQGSGAMLSIEDLISTKSLNGP